MIRSPRVVAGVVGLTATFLLVAVPAAAAPKPITAKLPKAGYTAIALAANGEATSVEVGKRKRLRLRPPARRVTLHFRDRSGAYAGPLVTGRKGRRAVMGVKAGAKLGRIAILGRKGYAKPRGDLARRMLDSRRVARAKRGVPVGAGVLGRVRSKGNRSGGPGRDQDSDGIPGAFDVDDDGDLLLDNFEATGGAIAMAAQDDPPPPEPPVGQAPRFRVFSNLKVQLADSLNANAGDVTRGQIDQLVSSAAGLAIEVPPGDDVELDCGGLAYCSAGGSGRTMEPFPNGQPFPSCCDPDGDGHGSIFAGTTGDFQLRTGAPADEIGAGDTMIERIADGGAETELPGVLNYIFNTTPALIAWQDSAGNSGVVDYPVEAGDPGQPEFPFEVAPGSDGDVVVTLSYWRPQRRAISGSGEGTGFVDIGRLQYTADVPNGPGGGSGGPPGAGPGNCPTSNYATTDPNLQPHPTDPIGGLVDQREDSPADPANTLAFSINLTDCLASAGLTWSSGQNLQVDIQARSQFGDNAAQLVNFRLK